MKRSSSTQRGYSRDWAKARRAFLREHPECFLCGGVADQVHHGLNVRDFPLFRLDDSHLVSLCGPCHSRQTRAEDSGGDPVREAQERRPADVVAEWADS